MITIQNEEHFNKLLSRAHGNVVVLFTAPNWCGPCRALEPHFTKMDDSELVDEFIFAKVVMGETREDTFEHWATERFGILGVPQVFKFDSDLKATPLAGRTVISLIKELVS